MTTKPAKLGCMGCVYEEQERCPSTEYFEKKIEPALWPCTINGESIIWVDENDLPRKDGTPEQG